MEHQKHPYLLKNLTINRSNMVWCTDITYIKIGGGFVYLMAIIDVYSRMIISWDISTTMDESLCLRVLEKAYPNGAPEYMNTDQGSQFTGEKWINAVSATGAKISMDGKGRWADNIPIERFWRSAKHELIFLESFDSIKDLRQAVANYMAFYNTKRPHQSLNYAFPCEVYSGLQTVSAFEFKKIG